MEKFLIKGGKRLCGEITIAGAKNAALPMLAAALLTKETLILSNVPQLRDVSTMLRLLAQLGVSIGFNDKMAVQVNAEWLNHCVAPYELVRAMRASFLVLGPLLARCGEARVSLPGGCAIGSRPVDLHLDGLRALGAEITVEQGYVHATTPNGLVAAEIHFPLVSVGATENVMMAACLAKGKTVLNNVACEPEIIDLANLLNQMGANISGAGTSTMTIEGVSSMHGTQYRVMPDRVETATYLAAAVITRGDITLKSTDPHSLHAALDVLRKMGAELTIEKDRIRVQMSKRPQATHFSTAVYPGFPTDMQAQFLAINCIAEGNSCVTETIFENRFMHVQELARMGANIQLQHNMAICHGVPEFIAAPVCATDLRASASLVLAALAAKGETLIDYIYHIDRGYEHIEEKLRQLGANIRRVNVFPMTPPPQEKLEVIS